MVWVWLTTKNFGKKAYKRRSDVSWTSRFMHSKSKSVKSCDRYSPNSTERERKEPLLSFQIRILLFPQLTILKQSSLYHHNFKTINRKVLTIRYIA